MDRARAALFAGLFGLAISGCDDPPAPTSQDTGAATSTSTAAASANGPVVLARAPEGDVADVVRRESDAARAAGQTLIVYVGAPWCEPCETFHKAAEAKRLDALLPPLRFLEFNLDNDAERLAAAGYQSKLIPLFVVPNADGTASDRRVEGSVKGDGAIRNLVPRIRSMLTAAP